MYAPITITVNNLTAISEKKFFTTFPDGHPFSAESFASKIDSVTNKDQLVYLADLNGDDKLDIITVGGSGLTIYKNLSINNGQIVFDKAQIFATSCYSFGAVIADMDGDGKPDIMLSNETNLTGTVAILRNISTSSTIQFAAMVEFVVGNEPMGVAVGDLNGDGKPDLAVANYNSQTISVFQNTTQGGTINFGNKIDLHIVSDEPYNVKVMDIDGDGKQDLIVLGQYTYLLRNITQPGQAISFDTAIIIKTGGVSMITGDLDGDGKTDIVIADYYINTDGVGAVLRNTSSPGKISFDPAKFIYFNGQSTPRSVNMNDFDGDGKPELVFVNDFVDSVYLIKNTSTPGNISFSSNFEYLVGNSPEGICSGDIDGDGIPDIVTANYNSYPNTTVSIIRNLSATTSIHLCVGTNTTLKSNINGLSYQWQENAGMGFINVSDNGYLSGTNSSNLNISNAALVRSDYQYRCIVDGSTSKTFIVWVLPTPLIPSVTIADSDSTTCVGSTVRLIANEVNGGYSPSYQWLVNGVKAGTDTAIFTSSSLTNGDQVSAIMTSSEICVSSLSDSSNILKINITDTVSPGVTIKASSTNICKGSNVVFTAIPTNGGSLPHYQWMVNAVKTGTDTSVFTSLSLANGDQVSAIMTSSEVCVSNLGDSSNILKIKITDTVSSRVTIKASSNNICKGGNIIFTATPTNGGSLPHYQWMVNGNNIGKDSNIYSNNTIINGDNVNVVLKSNASCLLDSLAQSNNISIAVIDSVLPNISILGYNSIQQGQIDTINAILENGGTSPFIQWQDSTTYNSWTNIPQANSTTINYLPNESGDKLRCVLTGNATCSSIMPVVSNTIIISLVPLNIISNIKFYPNPVGNVLNIDSLNISDNWINLEIIALNGKTCIVTQSIIGMTTALINVSTLPTGIYIVVLRNNAGKKVSFKIVKA